MKQQIIEDIQTCCDKFENIFLFSVTNMRNAKLKEVRTEWRDSRFFFGKNRVMQLGLKRVIENEDEATLKNLAQLSDRLTGQCGLLFTNHPRQVVIDWFESYFAVEFARAGFKASETVELPAGQMEEFSHAIEPHLRQLGMPTKLERGIVTLYKDFTVCTAGQLLTPEQAKILKLVGRPIAEFRMHIECSWTKEKGFELFIERITKSKKKAPKREKKKGNKKAKKETEAEVVEETQEESENEAEEEDEEESMDED